MTAQFPNRVRLSIFHTNDMHGRLEAMARLSAFARRLRAEAAAQGGSVFFWDAGDAADRRVPTCSLTKGAAFSPILNAMGYQLQTMGNAISLPYGPQALAAVSERANFPILAANCHDADGPLPEGVGEYAQVPLPGGLTMGVIGLTAPWGSAYEIYGLHLPEFCDVARDLVSELRAQGVRPVVVLSHLGLGDDRCLAETVAGIDLIIGAHSHDRLPSGEVCNNVLIAQAGEYAQALGRVDLTLEPASPYSGPLPAVPGASARAGGGGRVLDRVAQVLDVPQDESPDPAVSAAIAAAEAEVQVLRAQTIGILESPLDLDHFRECGVGNLAADALRERLGAEVALVASGLFHQALSAGAVTLGQLDAACFTTANPCLTEVRGAQILAALEWGLDPAIAQARHPGLRGTPVGIPQISGMRVVYDPDAEVGRQVQHVVVGDEPLDPDRSYRLAHTDAETMAEVGYLVLDQGQESQHEVPTILREAIEDYLRRHSPLARPTPGRWLRVSR